MLAVLTLLFTVLQPGVIFTFPDISVKGVFSQKTSVMAILVHAILFAAVLYVLRNFQIEGFENAEDLRCYNTAEIIGISIGGGVIGLIIGLLIMRLFFFPKITVLPTKT